MRRLIFALAAAALLAACSPNPGLDGLSRGETGHVVQIKEGDDFVLDNGLEVRLAGVEAPHGSELGADDAKAALGQMVQGKSVVLLYGGARRDRYGRAIAQVKAGSKWVQRALLEAGRVRVHTYSDNAALVHPMLTAEAGARQSKAGLWSLSAYRVFLPSETQGQRGFTVVEGRVARVTSTAGATWLDFAEGGAAARIPADAIFRFRRAGLAPQSLAGQVVRVRGWLSGPSLTLDHPAALERISEAKLKG